MDTVGLGHEVRRKRGVVGMLGDKWHERRGVVVTAPHDHFGEDRVEQPEPNTLLYGEEGNGLLASWGNVDDLLSKRRSEDDGEPAWGEGAETLRERTHREPRLLEEAPCLHLQGFW